MFVCICNTVTDKQIEECSKDGCTFKELTDKLCIGKNCGNCLKEASIIFKEASNNN